MSEFAWRGWHIHFYIHCHIHCHVHCYIHCHVHCHVHIHGFVHGHVHGRSCLFHGEFICISSTVILFLQTTCEWGLVSVMARYALDMHLWMIWSVWQKWLDLLSIYQVFVETCSTAPLWYHIVFFSIQPSVNQTSSIYPKYHPLPQVLVG